MVSKRRKVLSAAVLFYLFLRLQSCLALYIDPPRPLRVPEEGSERWYRNVANFCTPSSCFTYSYGGRALWNPVRLSSGTPTCTYDGRLHSPFSVTYPYGGTAATDPLPQRHLVFPILTAAMFSTVELRKFILRHSHLYQILRRQHTVAIFVPILTAAQPPRFLSAILFCTFNHVKFSSGTPIVTNLYGGSSSGTPTVTILTAEAPTSAPSCCAR